MHTNIVKEIKRKKRNKVIQDVVLGFTTLILLYLFACMLVLAFPAEAHTVGLTAEVKFNNCNVSTTKMPFPVLVSESESMFSTVEEPRSNWIYHIKNEYLDSYLFVIWTDYNELHFYLDDASWSIKDGIYYKPVCSLSLEK